MPGRARHDLLAVAAGALLVLLGVLGFLPGATAHLGRIRLAGEGSHAELFGTFRVSVLLNAIHVVVGVCVPVVARVRDATRGLAIGGVLLLALWALGAVAAGRFVPLSPADNWLHLGFGVALLGAAAL
ncbi:MAG TPA: DUF4383 domain-containing protein [Gaiellaceae bacterium]|nr:DUF4383 domain-containing protein [Gaiellaceae bacterium]